MSNFAFLSAEWPDLYDEAQRAERLARVDPRTSCIYARRTLELALAWLYAADDTLDEPRTDTLSDRIRESTLRSLTGGTVNSKMHAIRVKGNDAAHGPTGQPLSAKDAVRVAAELFHVMYWLARNYTRAPANRPADGITFDPSVIRAPAPAGERQKTRAELKALEEEFARADSELAEQRARNAALDSELAEMRAQVAEAKAANTARADTHDYDEDQTRELLIDRMLTESGWDPEREHTREYPLSGMPNSSGDGRADYVLWDDDGRPLAVVEAKRTSRSAAEGEHQASLYADALEARTGQRPVIFCTNGYDTRLWDDTMYPPRPVRGFYTKAELRLLIQRRARHALAGVAVNPHIAGRPYQQRAIARIGEAYDGGRRKALVVMATGAGKTRTTVALVDQLMRAGWVKRALFLADRTALVTQAANAFKTHLPDSNPVNLLTERSTEGRVYVSTYPTMMGLIDEIDDRGRRRFGPGHFDLVVIDEAHRSVYRKYGEIFAYFDSLLLGLTATPKDEVDRNTYRLFELEEGEPTDVYSLEDAAADGYLVLPKTVSVPLRFQREGIRYDDLSEEEKDAWDALEWGDDGDVPDRVEADEVNAFLFNTDTVDKALEVLMTRGHRVAGGDRLGKTIVFARNSAHAEFIAERFNATYPEYAGGFARVITHQSDYAHDLIDKFATPDQPPHIAISVDMLDTGIDVPEVLNLVLFKLVRSKTKFWQMIGRGTRLCPDIFGPGRDKQDFLVFDLCQNIEFFNQDLPASEGNVAPSLGERLLRERLDVLHALDRRGADDEAAAEDGTRSEPGLRRDVAEVLRRTVAGMNPESFLVRPHRRYVEFYSEAEHWHRLAPEDYGTIADNLAGLPTEYRPEDDTEDAKRFDLLALRLQLGRLTGAAIGEERARGAVQELASALLGQTAIPRVREQQEFLEEVSGGEWWVDITPPMLESMRRRMRPLVGLVERARRTPVYTDFADELGEVAETPLRGAPAGAERDRLDNRVRRCLRARPGHPAVLKLRGNEQIGSGDLAELAQLLHDEGAATQEEVERAGQDASGLGGYVRGLLGLDRAAAEAAFAGFRDGRDLSGRRGRFVALLADFLVSNGALEVGALYDPPFSTLAPNGPEDLFGDDEIDALMDVLAAVQATADPAQEAA